MSDRHAPSPRYDLCVLGAGPAGLAAAARAHDLGKTVALVDPGRPGGAGIADGALSSKTLWHLAMDFARARRSDRGYHGGQLAVAWPELLAEVRRACDEAWAHGERLLAHLGQPSARGGRVDRVVGRGRFVAPDLIEVDGPAPTRIAADRFLLAVGSRPRGLPGVTVDGERVMTSDQIEHVGALPADLAIVGAGVVGCEYATIFASLGQTRVELLDRGARILPFEDGDVAAAVAASFDQLGVRIHARAQLVDLAVDDGGVRLVFRQPGPDGGEQVVERRVARALLAVGRAPAIADLGLDVAGVATDRGGVVCPASGHCRTTAPRVWAAGDVTADVMLANVAEQEGRHAVEDMFGLAPRPIRYQAQSAIYFFRPEVAAVGLGEQAAAAAGLPYRAAVISHRLLRRAIAMRATDGFVKLIAAPDGALLGLRVVGPQASSCIQGVALLIERGGTLADLDHCLHPHPAVTEGVQEAARLLLGTSLYKPAAFPGLARVVEG